MRDYYIYLRKSRRDIQAEKFGQGETLARHKKTLIELTKRLEIYVKPNNILEEIESGETIANRPQIQLLIRKMRNDLVEGVLVVDLDRLTRGKGDDQSKIIAAFKENNVKVIMPMRTFDLNDELDEDYIESIFHFSHKELKTITRRTQMGRARASLEGKYVGNIAPYGYKRHKLTHTTGYTLKEEKEEADVVRYIFELYTVGEKLTDKTTKRLGTTLITKKLNDLNIKTRHGKQWTLPTIRNILKNPVYVGKIKWNTRPQKIKTNSDGTTLISRPINRDEKTKILVDGLHKAIISNETWELSCYYMSQNPPRPIPSSKEIKNPLAGIIVCGKCGKHMVRRPYSSGQEPTLICPLTSCNNVSSKLSLVEKKLIIGLNEIVKDYKLNIQSATNKKEPPNHRLQLINRSIKKEQKELYDLVKRKENVIKIIELKKFKKAYTEDDAYERLADLKNNISECQNRLKIAENNLIEETNCQKLLTIDIPKIKNIIDLYNTITDVKNKNDILNQLLIKVEYIKENGGRWNHAEDNFTLKIYPRFYRLIP